MQSSNFDFSILYTKLSHKDLVKALFDLINFDFNRSSKKKKKDFSLQNLFWSNKPKTKFFFTKTSLKRTMQFLTENSYFSVGNVLSV